MKNLKFKLKKVVDTPAVPESPGIPGIPASRTLILAPEEFGKKIEIIVPATAEYKRGDIFELSLSKTGSYQVGDADKAAAEEAKEKVASDKKVAAEIGAKSEEGATDEGGESAESGKDYSSASMSQKEAIAAIQQFQSKQEVHEFTKDEDRAKVIEAAKDRIEELK